jgi:hypothetical protein
MEAAGVLAGAFGMSDEELALAGFVIMLGEIFGNEALSACGTYLAGWRMLDLYDIGPADIMEIRKETKV